MKRTKLIATLLASLMCLSVLSVGVWAAVTISFSLGANLQFYPEGVYVELSGQVYRGTSTSTLKPLTSDSRFTLDSVTNFDNSTGEPSGNFPIESWNIENLNFTPSDRYIQVEVSIKNHSNTAINVSPTALLNNQDITSATFSNLTITENSAEVARISDGATKTYKVLLQLDADTTFTANSLSISFDFEESTSRQALDFVKWNPQEEYYYIEMGETLEGDQIEWQLVLERISDDTSVQGVESMVTGNKTELEGKTFYFLFNTWTGGVGGDDETLITNKEACSFQNYYDNSGRQAWNREYDYDDSSQTGVFASDYATSVLRGYVNQNSSYYRGYTGGLSTNYIYDPAPHTASGQTANGYQWFLDHLFLTDYEVYNYITPRTISDLYKKMDSTGGGANSADMEYKGSYPNIADSLWLLSQYEAYMITGNGNTTTGVRSWNAAYWLRSTPSTTSYYADYIKSSGSLGYGDDVCSTYVARPAFMMSF